MIYKSASDREMKIVAKLQTSDIPCSGLCVLTLKIHYNQDSLYLTVS